jgi:hypothetical protein
MTRVRVAGFSCSGQACFGFGARAHQCRWLRRRPVRARRRRDFSRARPAVALFGILASLRQELGDLDRIAAWLRVYGMVSPASGFTAFPLLMNGASSLIQEVFGPEIGDHARVAIGVGA